MKIHEIEGLYYIESRCKASLLLHFQKPSSTSLLPPFLSQLYINPSTVSSPQKNFFYLSPPKIHNHHYITLLPPHLHLCHPISAVPIPLLPPPSLQRSQPPKTQTNKTTQKKIRLCTSAPSQIPPKFPIPRCQMPIVVPHRMLH